MTRVYKNLPLALLEIQHEFLFTQNGLISEKEHLSRQQLRAELKPVIKYLQHRADYPDVPYTLPIMEHIEPTYAIEILNEHRTRKEMELVSSTKKFVNDTMNCVLIGTNNQNTDLRQTMKENYTKASDVLSQDIKTLTKVINLLSIEGAEKDGSI